MTTALPPKEYCSLFNTNSFQDESLVKRGPRGFNGPAGENGQYGLSLISASINNDGELITTLSNDYGVNVGRVIGPTGLKGPDGGRGSYLSNALIQNDRLLIYTSDAPDVGTDVGYARGPSGDAGNAGSLITSAYVDQGTGELKIEIDGVEYNLGLVNGANGEPGNDSQLITSLAPMLAIFQGTYSVGIGGIGGGGISLSDIGSGGTILSVVINFARRLNPGLITITISFDQSIVGDFSLGNYIIMTVNGETRNTFLDCFAFFSETGSLHVHQPITEQFVIPEMVLGSGLSINIESFLSLASFSGTYDIKFSEFS